MPNIISRRCAMCGKEHQHEVTDKQYKDYYRSDKSVQDIFPDKDIFFKEALISGFCFPCQEKVFHRPLPEHEAEWGELVKQCPYCERNLYDKIDRDADGVLHCNCGYE